VQELPSDRSFVNSFQRFLDISFLAAEITAFGLLKKS